MTDEKLLHRITVNPKVMIGKPVIRGTRLGDGLVKTLRATMPSKVSKKLNGADENHVDFL